MKVEYTIENPQVPTKWPRLCAGNQSGYVYVQFAVGAKWHCLNGRHPPIQDCHIVDVTYFPPGATVTLTQE